MRCGRAARMLCYRAYAMRRIGGGQSGATLLCERQRGHRRVAIAPAAAGDPVGPAAFLLGHSLDTWSIFGGISLTRL